MFLKLSRFQSEESGVKIKLDFNYVLSFDVANITQKIEYCCYVEKKNFEYYVIVQKSRNKIDVILAGGWRNASVMFDRLSETRKFYAQ